MPSYAVTDIMVLNPCTEYSEARVAELWAGREALAEHEIAELVIPIEDRIWALCKLAAPRIARLFSCDCAERALRRVVDAGGSTDPRSWYAIVIARLYADGDRTDEDLESARSAARSAAEAAAAWYAARSAVWATIRVAVNAATGAAANAAEVAAEATTEATEATTEATEATAERAWQIGRLVEMMEADNDNA